MRLIVNIYIDEFFTILLLLLIIKFLRNGSPGLLRNTYLFRLGVKTSLQICSYSGSQSIVVLNTNGTKTPVK